MVNWMPKAHLLLWIVCVAALFAGTCVVLFHKLLSHIYVLPEQLVLFIGLVNLAYGAYSLSLLRPGRATISSISLLVVANLGWTLACAALAAWFNSSASWLGIALLVAEGAFVALLALFEWRYRSQIVACGRMGPRVGA